MDSSTVSDKYPKRRWPPGKSPVLKRSLHHNCKLSEFGIMMEAVGEEVYNDVMNNSSVGVILKLASMGHSSMGYTWAARTVQNFLANQLQIDRLNELWCLIGGRPVRFSLHEFEDLTHLNCDVIDDKEVWDIDHTDFWKDMNVQSGNGPNWAELTKVFSFCNTWPPEKKKKLALLFVLQVGIYGLSRNGRIPLMVAKRVLDKEAFEKYPWGRVAFKEIMKSLNAATFIGDNLTLHGCVHALLIWAYEAVPIIGERYGKRRALETEIPLLRWASSRMRFNFDSLLEEDKKTSTDGKVRVRHMVTKPLDKIYPTWDDDEDPKLDNMIRDIHGGCLDETFWDTKKASVKGKKRKIVEESEDDFVEKPEQMQKTSKKEKSKKKAHEEEKKKQKKSKSNSEASIKTKEKSKKEREEVDMSISLKEIKKKKMSKSGLQDSHDVEEVVEKKGKEGGGDGEVLKLLRLLMAKVDTLDSRILSLEGNKDKAPEKVTGGEKETGAEKDINADGLLDAASKVDAEEPSWIVEQQATSQPEHTINRVLRNPKVSPNVIQKVKVEKAPPKEKAKRGVGKIKDVEAIDMTKTPPRKTYQSSNVSSASTDTDPNAKALHNALDKLVVKLKDDFVGREGRKLFFARSQVDPYIPNSGTVRIMCGVTASSAVYDPFARPDMEKVDRLMEYVKSDLDNEDSSITGVEFYLTMMTPKEMWPEGKSSYGWLGTQHMVAAFKMFHKRSMQKPSPFKSERIAFIDPNFTDLWCSNYNRDFKQKGKNWVFTPGFPKLYNGLPLTLTTAFLIPQSQEWMLQASSSVV